MTNFSISGSAVGVINTTALPVLKLNVRTVYGVKKYYPICDTAKLLCELTTHTTFTKANLDILRKLGYTFQDVTPREESF